MIKMGQRPHRSSGLLYPGIEPVVPEKQMGTFLINNSVTQRLYLFFLFIKKLSIEILSNLTNHLTV